MGDSLYFWLNFGAVLFPVLLSFDKKVNYVSDWKYTFAAIVAVGIPFLTWDYFFTEAKFWGFNPDYISEYYLFNLPIEEVLFFITVPFSCTFIYRCSQAYFDRLNFDKFNLGFSTVILLYGLFVLVFGWGRWYSSLVAVLVLISLGLAYKMNWNFKHFPFSFTLAMIPFLLMNGILTGAITDDPIVWYSSEQITEWRYLTIPIEDVLYAFVLLYWNVAFFEWANKKKLTT